MIFCPSNSLEVGKSFAARFVIDLCAKHFVILSLAIGTRHINLFHPGAILAQDFARFNLASRPSRAGGFRSFVANLPTSRALVVRGGAAGGRVLVLVPSSSGDFVPGPGFPDRFGSGPRPGVHPPCKRS